MSKRIVSGKEVGVKDELVTVNTPTTPTEELQQRTPQVNPLDNFGSLVESAVGPAENSFDAYINEQERAAKEEELAQQQQAEAATLDDLMAINQQAIEEQQARQQAEETVSPMEMVQDPETGMFSSTGSRIGQETTQPWDFRVKGSFQAQGRDGGLNNRAVGMQEYLSNPESTMRSLVSNRGGNINKLFTNMGLFNNEINMIDPMAAAIISMTTENYIADVAEGETRLTAAEQPRSLVFMGRDEAGEFVKLDEQDVQRVPTKPEDVKITKAAQNEQLGRQIYRDIQRARNYQSGRPVDQYTDINRDDATVLGDMAKEFFYEANKQPDGSELITRTVNPETKQVEFGISPAMYEMLKQGAGFRKRLFKRKVIRPQKLPMKKLRGDTRLERRRVTGGPQRLADRVEEAMDNQNSVAHVVDTTRHKILLASAIPALMVANNSMLESDPVLQAFGNAAGVGSDKLNEYRATETYERRKVEADPNYRSDYDADEQIRVKRNDLAQQLFGIATERGSANYLTYYLQSFAGRMAVQQSHFDPMTGKMVRFVTRSAVPTALVPGSKLTNETAWDAYALVIGLNGISAMTRKERQRAMKDQAAKLEAWGKELQNIYGKIDDAQVEAVADAIAKGVNPKSPEFPKLPMPEFDVNNQTHMEILEEVNDRGEDGFAFIDGLMDFAKFQDAQRNNRTHYSYINPTVDGKTNGLAANAMQLGDMTLANMVGVTRSEGSMYAVDQDKDIRDVLAETLTGPNGILERKIPGSIDPEDAQKLRAYAKVLFSYRPLNKETTMTYGYGKLMETFGELLDKYGYLIAEDAKTKHIAPIHQWLTGLDKETKAKYNGWLMSTYAQGMVEVMSAEGVESRFLMWGVATLSAIADVPFSIRSPMGHWMSYGGMVRDPSKDVDVKYGVRPIGETKRTERKAFIYGSKPSAAAGKSRSRYSVKESDAELIDKTGKATDVKEGIGYREFYEEVGGAAWGAAAVGPIQSVDGATVVSVFSGKSWDKLNANTKGNPYVMQVYDAFKTDIGSLDTLYNEVNNNWFDINMEWSYLKEAKRAYKRAKAAFEESFKDMPKDARVNLSDYKMIDSLLSDEDGVTKKGAPKRLVKKIAKLTPYLNGYRDGMDRWLEAEQFALSIMKASNLNSQSYGMVPVRDIKVFYLQMFKLLNLEGRLDYMIKLTEKRKAELKAKVKSQIAKGELIAQYHDH